MSTTSIKLPEHNSSRLLFVDTNDPDFTLDITEIAQDLNGENQGESSCSCATPKFLLGKLNQYIWIIEDSGDYDTNHRHRAELSNTDQLNNTEVMFNVSRLMEYGSECDRLYTNHSGGIKFILLDSPSEDQTADLFIKYERSLPCFEYITDLRDNNTGQIYPACIAFYKYINNSPSIFQIVQLVGGLTVVDSNTQQPMQNIDYCNITVKNAVIDFNKLTFTYSVTPNTSNNVKINYIGTQSLQTNPNNDFYGKFISRRYYQENDNFIEPGFFIIQAPQNRSWICYRTCRRNNYIPGGVVDVTYRYVQDNNSGYEWDYKYKDGCQCFKVKAPLNGYNGNLINNKYIYEIDVDRNDDRNFFLLVLPSIFCDYESVEYYDQNGIKLTRPIDLGQYDFGVEDIYNEFDGMFYKLFMIPIGLQNCKIYKIKLTYNK